MSRYLKIYLNELREFILNKRVFALLFLLTVYTYIYVRPIRTFCIVENYPVTMYLGIFMFTQVYYILVVCFGAIYIFGNAPFTDKLQMYRYVRLGKNKWLLIRTMNIFISSFLYALFLNILPFLLCIPKVTLDDNGFGKIIYTLSATNLDELYNLQISFDPRIVANRSPFSFYVKTVLILTLIFSFLGLVIFAISVSFSNKIAIIAASFISILTIIMENLPIGVKKILTNILPTEWAKIYKFDTTALDGIKSIGMSDALLRLFIVNFTLTVIIFLIFSGRKNIWK